MMSFHNFIDKKGNSFGSFEIFEDDPDESFYWWPCLPGSLPETLDDPAGPFTSYDAAFQNAQESAQRNSLHRSH